MRERLKGKCDIRLRWCAPAPSFIIVIFLESWTREKVPSEVSRKVFSEGCATERIGTVVIFFMFNPSRIRHFFRFGLLILRFLPREPTSPTVVSSVDCPHKALQGRRYSSLKPRPSVRRCTKRFSFKSPRGVTAMIIFLPNI